MQKEIHIPESVKSVDVQPFFFLENTRYFTDEENKIITDFLKDISEFGFSANHSDKIVSLRKSCNSIVVTISDDYAEQNITLSRCNPHTEH